MKSTVLLYQRCFANDSYVVTDTFSMVLRLKLEWVKSVTPVVDCVVSKSRPSCYGYAFTAVVHSGESDWPARTDVVVRNCHRGPLFVAA